MNKDIVKKYTTNYSQIYFFAQYYGHLGYIEIEYANTETFFSVELNKNISYVIGLTGDKNSIIKNYISFDALTDYMFINSGDVVKDSVRGVFYE